MCRVRHRVHDAALGWVSVSDVQLATSIGYINNGDWGRLQAVRICAHFVWMCVVACVLL
jgi:hypothetical protein